MLVHPNFDPVLVSVGLMDVHWYGVMYLLAFAVAWLLAMHRTRQIFSPVSKLHIDSLITYGAFGAIIGGRVGYVVFYFFDAWTADPLLIFYLWDGGMSFHGGLIGVAFAVLFYAHRIHVSYLHLTDFVAPLIPLSLGFGWLGHFIGQELWGHPTSVPWAMIFPNDLDLLARHPFQLYQVVLEGMLLFAFIFRFSRCRRPRGAVTGFFLVSYGFLRFFTEFFREPDLHIGFDFLGWVTRGQLLSAPMVLLGLGLLVYAYVVHFKNEREDPDSLKEK